MATTETSHSQSADSYIGSFISLISKSDIRYEGVIFHINPLQSSIGLKNVRSFGAEGRNKVGPQVVPSDKVYDYIYFRGNDIKDLQVLSSLSVQSKSAIPDDPAIIQSHYHHPAATSIMPHSASSSMTSFTSNSQLGLPSSAFQDSVPQYQPVGHVLSLDSSTSTTVKSNEHNMPTYWQGLNGPLGGYSFLQQQSLLRPPPGLLTSPGLRQMQRSIMDVSIPSAVPNFSEIPHPLFPPSSSSSLNSRLLPSSSASSLNSTLLLSSSASSLNSTLLPSSSASSLISTLLPSSSASSQNTTTLPPSSYSSQRSTMLPPSSGSSLNSTLTSISSSALPSNLPLGYAASSVSKEASVSNAPGLKLSSCLPLASALTSAVDTIKIALQFGEKSKSTLGSTSPYTNMSTHTPSIVGTSVSNHPEVPTPSLVTPGQLLRSAPTSPDTILFSLLPLQTAQKDIEVVQTSTLEPLSADANEAQAPSGEMNGASLDSQHHDKGRERGRRNRPYGSALHTPRSISGPVEERENKLYGTASHSHRSNISPSWRLEKVMNGTAPHPYYGSWGRAHGRTNMISHFVTKFTEDFDFEAMNKKFNKDEVWGQLGKSIEGISEDNGDADDSQKDDRQHDDGYGLLKVDIKPVYVKDEFFDSLSCNTFDREPKQGRSKFSEQKKLDVETFGGFRINHGGHGDRGIGRGGWSRGSRYGRGYGHGGRGLGRGVWSRVD
ncbi:protein decapping 5-like isoform X2 [Durio zibethinus]|uniref:Protein decapping 5-like isoform X2 n=1 Tax=Durio zibethinus TaxID=66656 RepID=A0A6P5XTW2_DURZI|nr:protein decapping 5-like isoform X2 [Durio zibethinus]